MSRFLLRTPREKPDPKSWRARLLAAWLALLAAATAPAGQPALPPAAEGRVLLIVDTSLAMRRRAAGTRDAVERLLRSDLGGCLRAGDTLGLWTCDSEVHMGRFPLQVWSASDKEAISGAVVEFLRGQRHRGWVNWDAALAEAALLVRESPAITLVVLTDGSSPPRGTPFDPAIAAEFAALRAEQRRVRLPLVLVLQAAGGRYLNYLVVQPQWPLVLSPPSVAQRPGGGASAAKAASPSPPPSPEATSAVATVTRPQPAALARTSPPAAAPPPLATSPPKPTAPPSPPVATAPPAPLPGPPPSAATGPAAAPATPPPAPAAPIVRTEKPAAGPAPRRPDAPVGAAASQPSPAPAPPPPPETAARSGEAQKSDQPAALPVAAAAQPHLTKQAASASPGPSARSAPPAAESPGPATPSPPPPAKRPPPAVQATVADTAREAQNGPAGVQRGPETQPAPAPPGQSPTRPAAGTEVIGAKPPEQPAPTTPASHNQGGGNVPESPSRAAVTAEAKRAPAGSASTPMQRAQEGQTMPLPVAPPVPPERPAAAVAGTNNPAVTAAVVTPRPRVNGRWLLAAGLVLLAVAVGGLLLIWRRGRPAPPHASLITQSLARDRSSSPHPPGAGRPPEAGGA